MTPMLTNKAFELIPTSSLGGTANTLKPTRARRRVILHDLFKEVPLAVSNCWHCRKSTLANPVQLHRSASAVAPLMTHWT
jgi:hypothetical protein